jgi:hypothetical protein
LEASKAALRIIIEKIFFSISLQELADELTKRGLPSSQIPVEDILKILIDREFVDYDKTTETITLNPRNIIRDFLNKADKDERRYHC